MLQSGSMESQRYISLMLNAEIDCKPSYEQLFLSRIQYDIAHSHQAGLYDIGVLLPRLPPERPTIATHTADSALTEERGKLFCHLTERIRSVAQNFTSEQRDCLFRHSIDPFETTKAVAYALHGLLPAPKHKVIRRWYQSSPCSLDSLRTNIESAIKIKHDRENEARSDSNKRVRLDLMVSTEDATKAFGDYIKIERQSMESYVNSMSGFKAALEEYLSNGIAMCNCVRQLATAFPLPRNHRRSSRRWY
jgi:hypothetical protein